MRRRIVIADINVVPYIDVSLVLLIIFMAVAPMTQNTAPRVINLPTASNKVTTEQPASTLLLTLHKDLSLTVKVSSARENFERKFERNEAMQFIQKRQKNHANSTEVIVIGADKTIAYAQIVSLMAQLKSFEVKRVALLVKSD